MIRFLRNILSSLATLILSLVLAIIIWITATQANDPTIFKSLQIPIEFIGQPSNTTLVRPSGPAQNVTLTIQGRASVVNEVTRDNFTALVDLSDAPLGEEAPVAVQVQGNKSQINISSQSPEQLVVHLEPLVSRNIPVRTEFRGDVARGYSRGQESVDPEEIVVVGTAAEVNALEFALVTITLSDDDRQTKVVEVQPIFYDAQGQVAGVRNLELSTRDVEVTVPINEAADFAEKIITVDLEGQPAPGYRILSVNVEPPTALVQGRPTQLNQLPQIKTETIDITGLTESFVGSVSLELPEGVEVADFTEITATIEIEPFYSARTYTKMVEPIGLSDDLEAEIDPESVRIVLFGPSPVLDVLTEDDIDVTVDLFEMEAGEASSLEPTVTFPDRGIELRSIQPMVVTISVTETMTTTIGVTETLRLDHWHRASYGTVANPSPNISSSFFNGHVPARWAYRQPEISYWSRRE